MNWTRIWTFAKVIGPLLLEAWQKGRKPEPKPAAKPRRKVPASR